MLKLHYLMVLAFVFVCAVFIVFVFRVLDKRKLKIFLITDVCILIIYLIWDYWAITRGSWYFDQKQILNLLIFRKIPVEEILFFIIVPFVTVLTYLSLQKLLAKRGKN
mgnify:CR=1 FL=1